MMKTNLCIEWGLFNGSMGIIADIYFANGHKPALDGKEHPDAILVHMPGYCGPEVIQGRPHLVPLEPLCSKSNAVMSAEDVNSHSGCVGLSPVTSLKE